MLITRNHRPDPFLGSSLKQQAQNELLKSQRDSVKAQLKGLMADRAAAEQALRLINIKIEKLVKDYDDGVLPLKSDDKAKQKQND